MTFCPDEEDRSEIETRDTSRKEVRQKSDPFKSLKRDWHRQKQDRRPFRRRKETAFKRHACNVYELAFSTVTARRFWDQQEMSLQTATGRSLPYEIVRIREGSIPREVRKARTDW